jgi:hypothetical protein
MNRFKQVRLSLSVASDDDVEASPELHCLAFVVAKVLEAQSFNPHEPYDSRTGISR